MCPGTEPLQTSVYLPHHLQWPQVSVRMQQPTVTLSHADKWTKPGCRFALIPVFWSVCLRCVCSPGYVGDDCSVDYNDCEEHRCQNGAQCVDELNGYACVCPEGYR